MEMKSVTSSQIHAVGYSPEEQKMHIQFKTGKDRVPGPVYEYSPVTPEQHAAFVGAESLGRHFGAHIKQNLAIKYRKL